MRYNFLVCRWIFFSMMLATMVSAQSNRPTREDVECRCGESLNRFGVSYRMGFNISARFKNLGGFAAQSNPGPATNGVDHIYDDGYNRVDSSTNAANSTWFWGYQNASQLPGNDTLVMNSSSSAAKNTSKNQEEDPQHGLEITYNRQLGRMGECKWGMEAAFGFTDVTIHDNGTLFGNVTRISDAYALGGTIAPGAPYNHGRDPSGSDPLISDVPIRMMNTISRGAVVNGQRKFDSEIYGLRVGPYLEIPLCERACRFR